jgi:adenine-specific DNA-methyltransferase
MALTAPTYDRNYGEVFTRRWVVEVLLDLTGYIAVIDLGELCLVEPSCGTGAFLGPAVERLITSAQEHGRPLAGLGSAIRAFDLQVEHVRASRSLCHELLSDAGVETTTAEVLAREWVRHADFLLDRESEVGADVVVGNPPYIRYDDLTDDLTAAYRSNWPTMRGRGDIYVGFIERSLRLLKPNGRAGFICADRWMRNQYGSALRELVAADYAVEHVWTMHDVDAFEAEVSAYPAITVLSNRRQGSVVVADTTVEFGADEAAALVASTRDKAKAAFTAPGVKAHRLPHWFAGSELWPTGSPARLALIEHLNDRFGRLHDQSTGTRVSIGVATGADKVYITKDPTVVEPGRALPLAMRRDLMSGQFVWQGNYLINPWDKDGSLVDLDDYPRMAAYLSEHPELQRRHVAQRDPTRWHRTIDKVNPGLTDRPKLLLQDMKAHIHPVLENGGYYPHHNLYYVISDSWDLEVLGGLLLSKVAQAFIEAYCVRMRGGTLRFQAQYLKQIRVPHPDSISAELAESLRLAFRTRDVAAATASAGAAYAIEPGNYDVD